MIHLDSSNDRILSILLSTKTIKLEHLKFELFMNKVNIPAEKVMEPGMTIMDIDNIWDYIDIQPFDLNEEEVDDVLEENDCDSWDEDYDYRDDGYDPWDDGSDWRSDYYDAFEDDPEAEWGRKW